MKKFKFGRKNSTATSATSSNKNSPKKEKIKSSRTSKSSASFQAPNSPPHSPPSQDKDYLHSHTFGQEDLHSSSNNNNNMPVAQDHHSYTSEPFGITTDPSTVPYKSRAPPHLNVSNPWNRFKIFDSPFPRYRHAASAISSDKNEIFIMGGLKDGSVFGDTWRIIPHEGHDGDVLNYSAENIEITNNNNPPARVGHSSVLCGNAFIIYGGDTVETDEYGFPDNNFYLFNINNHKYTIPSHILNKPNGRYGHTIGVVAVDHSSSSRLYLFGGQLENDVFNDMYYFELNSFKSPKATWKIVEPLNNFKPPPLTNHSMSIYKEKIYVFGGVYNNERVSNDLWEFDVEHEQWKQIQTSGTLPLPVNEHSACVVDDRLYIYGGNDFSGVIYSSLYVLDLKTFTWYKLLETAEENGPGPRCGHSMTYLPKYNKLIIMGGDKNDYIVADATNFDTYETFNGAEVGTMIYELDINIVDQFMSEPIEPRSSRKPRKVAASASAQPGDGFERHSRRESTGPEDYATPRASPPPPPPQALQPQSQDRAQLDRGLSTNTMNRHTDFVDVETPSGTNSHIDQEEEEDNVVPHVNPYARIDRDTDANIAQTNEPISDEHVVQDELPDDEDAQYLRRRSLDPKFNHEHEDVATNGVSGAGVAAAFAAAGAAGKAAGHASVLKRSLGTYDDKDEEEQDADTIEGVARNRRSSLADKSYGSTSYYPDITSDHETSTYPRDRSYLKDTEDEEEEEQEEVVDKEDDDVIKPISINRNISSSTTRGSRGTAIGGGASAVNDRRLNQIIEELRNELDQVKSSTSQQLQTANTRINSLQEQNAQLQSSHKNDIDVYTRQINDKDAMINELKSSLDPSAWDPEAPSTTTNLSELSRYKLERLELNNKLVYLQQENAKLHDQFAEFEPFMNHQIGELAKFQKVIKVQEEQIEKLSFQVKDQEVLHKEINEWKTKFDNLQLEFDNYKAIHNDDDIDLEDQQYQGGDESFSADAAGNADNRSILSSARTRRDISTQLENLVNLWNVKQPATREVSPAITPENNPVVAKLQQQVDDLLRISKQNDEVSHQEIATLRQELTQRIANLKSLEENYRESLQSVNNTSKALKLNQEELNNQRNFMDKLIKENNELKMFKSAHLKKSNGSSTSTPVVGDDAFSDARDTVNVGGHVDDDDEGVISNAHFNMKIKDLEADLYIIKQERDQLKNNVTALQKQLYLAQNN
ncbi:KEL2 [Candida theae]|uniref:KEL2 n=1 Tax=Candida theae TaxID=1198502 RepID=A0AAD5BJB2_9ASCO|nr:KEL2 [Candida theae]KAI5966685.1 KEL2 [Candida theae]